MLRPSRAAAWPRQDSATDHRFDEAAAVGAAAVDVAGGGDVPHGRPRLPLAAVSASILAPLSAASASVAHSGIAAAASSAIVAARTTAESSTVSVTATPLSAKLPRQRANSTNAVVVVVSLRERRYDDLDQQLVGLERGRQVRYEELVPRDRSFTAA